MRMKKIFLRENCSWWGWTWSGVCIQLNEGTTSYKHKVGWLCLGILVLATCFDSENSNFAWQNTNKKKTNIKLLWLFFCFFFFRGMQANSGKVCCIFSYSLERFRCSWIWVQNDDSSQKLVQSWAEMSVTASHMEISQTCFHIFPVLQCMIQTGSRGSSEKCLLLNYTKATHPFKTSARWTIQMALCKWLFPCLFLWCPHFCLQHRKWECFFLFPFEKAIPLFLKGGQVEVWIGPPNTSRSCTWEKKNYFGKAFDTNQKLLRGGIGQSNYRWNSKHCRRLLKEVKSCNTEIIYPFFFCHTDCAPWITCPVLYTLTLLSSSLDFQSLHFSLHLVPILSPLLLLL